MGFDDHRWLSSEDLSWLVRQGQADLTAAVQVLRTLEAQKASREAEGTQFREVDLEKSRERVEELRERLQPYEKELQGRQ
jgi:hypothetical protein